MCMCVCVRRRKEGEEEERREREGGVRRGGSSQRPYMFEICKQVGGKWSQKRGERGRRGRKEEERRMGRKEDGEERGGMGRRRIKRKGENRTL